MRKPISGLPSRRRLVTLAAALAVDLDVGRAVASPHHAGPSLWHGGRPRIPAAFGPAVPQPQPAGEDAAALRRTQEQRERAPDIWTDHLRIRTYASQPAVGPGDRVSLTVEVEPLEGMHVYAPGTHDYRVVTLTLKAEPFVRQIPMRYPASEIYLFEPLDERVPVYQKPFELVQPLTIDSGPRAEAALGASRMLVLSGTLDYQACDDRVCFTPVSVPLSWSLALEPRSAEPAGPASSPR
jgi:hypothetical protein